MNLITPPNLLNRFRRLFLRRFFAKKNKKNYMKKKKKEKVKL